MIPKTGDMFGDADNPLEIAERFEAYKASLTKSAKNPLPTPGVPTLDGQASNPMLELQKSLGSEMVQKALSPELLESVRNSLASADVMKDIYAGTNSGIAGAGQLAGTGGLQAYDLEAPAKLLAPRPTPLRNRIARRKGVGTAHQYKRITGFTGTGTGGLNLLRPGITESTTNPFGSVNYLRGPKISYAGDQASVPYQQFGVSDQVSWAAQFSGQGYQDIRQLSQTSVLYSSMLLEERMLLGGRGTGSGFAGALAAPTAVAFGTPATAGAGQTGITGTTTNLYALVTSESVWGESVLSSVATHAITDGQVVTLSATLPAGATGMKVYLATAASAPGSNAAYHFYGRFSGGSTLIQGAVPTTGSTAATVATNGDTSGSALDYDGILTYCTGASSGYVQNISGVVNPGGGSAPTGSLNTANPGSEFFSAFASLYDSVKADPDEILANGNDRKQLSDLLKTSSSSSYQINLINAPGTEGAHDAQLGALVTGLQNEVTGKMVSVTVHPWLPQGTMPIISWTLPLPDSNISDVFAVYNVQDYMAIEWPVTQFAYETSSYWYGTMVCYAPAWQGAITGITKV